MIIICYIVYLQNGPTFNKNKFILDGFFNFLANQIDVVKYKTLDNCKNVPFYSKKCNVFL